MPRGKKVGSNLTEFKAAIDLRQIKGPLDSATAFVGASRDGFNITAERVVICVILN